MTNHLYQLRLLELRHKVFNQIEWLSSDMQHCNTSDTYGMRSASSIATPAFVKVRGVNITGSSAPGQE